MISAVYKVTFHILRSVYAAGRTRGVTLQPSDQIPSPVDWAWKYIKGKKIAVDWCGAYDVNLNDYIFSCTCKIICIQCKCVKKRVFYVPFCSCIFAFVLQQGNIVYIILEILFIHMQRHIQNSIND